MAGWYDDDVNHGPGVQGNSNKNTNNNSGSSGSGGAGGSGNKNTNKTSLDGDVINDLDNPDYSDVEDLYWGSQDAISDHYDNEPGKWTGGTYGQALKDAIEKITNREAFQYDVNADALYQQYKQQYMNQGKVAMQDAMGQASAMTGGYGNSYAATVGNQAYQGYLQQLNDVIPQLYQLALDKYNLEGEELYNQAGLYSTMYGQEYSEYRDTVADWQTELDRLVNAYNTERAFDFSEYQQQVSEDQWQQQFDESIRQFDLQYALQQAQLAKSGGGGGESETVKELKKQVKAYQDKEERLREIAEKKAKQEEEKKKEEEKLASATKFTSSQALNELSKNNITYLGDQILALQAMRDSGNITAKQYTDLVSALQNRYK